MYINLINTRKAMNLTIMDMSEIISKSPATYYKKENGEVITTVNEALLIARKLNRSVEYLFEL